LLLFFLPINKREKAWNSGKTYKDDSRILAKENHPRHKKTIYYNSDFKRIRKKMLPCDCSRCNKSAKLIHHKDGDVFNNLKENLEPLCKSCHTTLHNKQRGITTYKHNCEWCNKEFIVYHNRKCKQKFCSLHCKSKWYYEYGSKSLKGLNQKH